MKQIQQFEEINETFTSDLNSTLTIHEEDLILFQTLYEDLIETLPSLCELRTAINTLTNNLQQAFNDLQGNALTHRRDEGALTSLGCVDFIGVRVQQGYVGTHTNLIMRKVSERSLREYEPLTKTDTHDNPVDNAGE
jgi:hypothetical protein